MKKNLFAKLDETKSVEVSDEIVRGIPRSLSEAELDLVAGGAVIAVICRNSVCRSYSISPGGLDDSLD
jgi:hypothetical protein